MMENILFENLISLIILAYILISALEGSIPDSELELANMIFVMIFWLDLLLKISIYGLKSTYSQESS